MGDYAKMQDTISGVTAMPGDSVSTANVQLNLSKQSASFTKRVRTLRGLTITQLVCSLSLFIIGFSCFLLNHMTGSWRVTCFVGYGGWCGIFQCVAASLGVAAAFKFPRSRCILMAYFVLAIIGCVFAAVLVVLACIYISIFSYNSGTDAQMGTGFNTMMLLIALTIGITQIIATSIICSLWNAQGNQPTTTVLYIAPTQGGDPATDKPQVVVLPPDVTKAIVKNVKS